MLKLQGFSDYTLVTTAPRFRSVAAHFSKVLAGIRDGGEMHARYQELARLSDTDLAKRGLTRADIMHAVLTGGK
jgi:hypothetical protein